MPVVGNRGGGASRPVQAIDVATASAASTTMPTATLGMGEGPDPAALPGSGIRLSRCAAPRTSGMRMTG